MPKNYKKFTRYPISNIKKIKDDLERKASYLNMTKPKYLDFLIKGVMGDIMVSTEIIEKEKQRIKKAKKYMENILEVICENSSREGRRVTIDAYNSLLTHKLSIVKENWGS